VHQHKILIAYRRWQSSQSGKHRVGTLGAAVGAADAEDVVQETFIGVAKNLQKKKFDTSLGSFKSFLLNQARWRILDQFRRRKKQQDREAMGQGGAGHLDLAPL